MSDTITITDGTTSLNLNADSSNGFSTEQFTPPRVLRQSTRVSGYPWTNGSRTTASAFEDSTTEWAGHIRSTTVDAMEVLYHGLVKLLDQAQAWEERRTGSPVRLVYKRSSATNTAYWIIKGATIPDPMSDPQNAAVEASKLLRVRFTLTCEPVAHAGALTSAISSTGKTNQPGLNRVTASTIVGSLPGPVYATVKKTSSGTNWDRLWIALCPMVPTFGLAGGTADATSFSNSVSETTTVSTAGVFISLWYSADAAMFNYPVRHFIRVKLTTSYAGNVQFRYVYNLGFDAAGTFRYFYGPWITYDGTVGSWWLFDLGVATSLMQPATGRHVALTTGVVQSNIMVRSVTGASITVRYDYIEWVPYLSMTRLTTAAMPQNYTAVYEAVGKDGSFIYPRTPVSYQLTSGSVLDTLRVDTYGRLLPVVPGTTPTMWFAGSSATAHDHTATADLGLSYIPSYALGFRGNA